MILAYFAASGLVMGIFFKSFTLVISCVLAALVILVSAVKVGYGQRDLLETGVKADYAVSVVLRVLDGAGRRGRDGFQSIENGAGEAETLPRSAGTARLAVLAEDDFPVSMRDLYPPAIAIGNTAPHSNSGIGFTER